ncbi:MAG: glycosyltransferase [Lachnospiraceae bacterium]|jgi:rhamnosyltransferase|nr:glycosyltransferase [Lachnospiraceae bacterium]
MSVAVIIPIYKPPETLLSLLDILTRQTVKAEQIILINSGASISWDLLSEEELLKKYDTCVILHIDEAEFDHGGTRNFGVSQTKTDYFVMMTQDAVPINYHFLESLLMGIEDAQTAVCYARQRAYIGADELECFNRHFNYGNIALNKGKANIAEMGIKTYFCSNVCAIYRRAVFDELGGFAAKIIFNEDMVFAAKAINAGYIVRYDPQVIVFHSHDYSLAELKRRSFDMGVSHADFAEVFSSLPPEAEGLKMIRLATRHFLRIRKPGFIIKLFAESLVKYHGFRLGKRYRSLSRKRIMRNTMNIHYWKHLLS